MKKIYLLSLVALFFFACNDGTTTDGNEENVDQTKEQSESTDSDKSTSSVKYPFEAGIVKYESEVMGMNTVINVYFDNYGALESSISEVEMMGKKMTAKSLVKDGYLYSLAMDQKSGTKVKVESDFATYRFNSELIESKGGKKLGEEEILGKNCQIFSLTEDGVESKMWLWKNMLMKVSAEQNGMTYTMEVTKIEETSNFPDGIFDIPSDFNITEEEDLNMDDFGDENAAG